MTQRYVLDQQFNFFVWDFIYFINLMDSGHIKTAHFISSFHIIFYVCHVDYEKMWEIEILIGMHICKLIRLSRTFKLIKNLNTRKIFISDKTKYTLFYRYVLTKYLLAPLEILDLNYYSDVSHSYTYTQLSSRIKFAWKRKQKTKESIWKNQLIKTTN